MYNWIKVLHVLAIVSWMAGLLYLPRLFVYHAGVAPHSATSELFKIMERRLNKAIMIPAAVVSWLTGLWLAWDAAFFRQGWFHGKLLLVLAMTAVHGLLALRLREFAENRNQKRHVYFRIWNEIPTLLMIGIVILVIVKPF